MELLHIKLIEHLPPNFVYQNIRTLGIKFNTVISWNIYKTQKFPEQLNGQICQSTQARGEANQSFEASWSREHWWVTGGHGGASFAGQTGGNPALNHRGRPRPSFRPSTLLPSGDRHDKRFTKTNPFNSSIIKTRMESQPASVYAAGWAWEQRLACDQHQEASLRNTCENSAQLWDETSKSKPASHPWTIKTSNQHCRGVNEAQSWGKKLNIRIRSD